MRLRRSNIVPLALLTASLYATAQSPSPQLAAVLAQMDTASKSFHNATADFQWDFTQKVAGITDTSHQKGSMYIERSAEGVTFDATVFELDSGAPSGEPTKIIHFAAGTAEIYSPNVKQSDILRSGANQSSAESFLSLGFGGSGRDLANAWQITDGGPVTLTVGNRSVKTEKLILVSKDATFRNNFKQVTIWIDPLQDVSYKQVFDTPSGGERTANYTNVQLNPHKKIDKKIFAIPTKGVTRINH